MRRAFALTLRDALAENLTQWHCYEKRTITVTLLLIGINTLTLLHLQLVRTAPRPQSSAPWP